MFWDPTTNKFVSPSTFIIPTSFIQKEIRDIISENHERAFDWFNRAWSSYFGHSLTKFDDKIIFVGEPENINTRAIHVYSQKTQEPKDNRTEQIEQLTIEILTGKEQLAGNRASVWAMRTVAQNYRDATVSIFSCLPITRLIENIPTKQPKPVADEQGEIAYQTGDRHVASINPTLIVRVIKTDILPVDQNLVARSQIQIDIKFSLVKNYPIDPYQ